MTNLRGGFKRKPLSSMPETIIETVRRDKTSTEGVYCIADVNAGAQLIVYHDVDFAALERRVAALAGGLDTITFDEARDSRQLPLASIERVARYTAAHGEALAMSLFGFSATTRKLPGR